MAGAALSGGSAGGGSAPPVAAAAAAVEGGIKQGCERGDGLSSDYEDDVGVEGVRSLLGGLGVSAGDRRS